jgi:opacity protein-like surface antigen
MKKTSMIKHQQICRLAVAAIAVLSLGLAEAPAQVYVAPVRQADSSKDTGLYLNGDLGTSLMPNFKSPRFGFPGNFSADTGVRFGVEPGYNFLSTSALTLGGEFETGVIYNRLSSITEAGSPISLHGSYYQVPLLGNLVLKLHTSSRFTPYIGVGGGGDYSEAKIHRPGFYGYDRKDERVDPAAQGKAGVLFRINRATEVGLGYKFLADFPDHGRYVATHSISADVSVSF